MIVAVSQGSKPVNNKRSSSEALHNQLFRAIKITTPCSCDAAFHGGHSEINQQKDQRGVSTAMWYAFRSVQVGVLKHSSVVRTQPLRFIRKDSVVASRQPGPSLVSYGFPVQAPVVVVCLHPRQQPPWAIAVASLSACVGAMLRHGDR